MAGNKIMKTKITKIESRLGILLPKHIRATAATVAAPGVAAAIPASGIAIREVVEYYQFDRYGGGGVRSRFEFLNVEPAIEAAILSALGEWMDKIGIRPRKTLNADHISHALSPEFCNGGLFNGEANGYSP